MSTSLPILAFEQADLNVFPDTRAACTYIEPPDVSLGDVFDADGASIMLRGDGARPGWFGSRGHVAVAGRLTGSEHRERLRELLEQHVAAVGTEWYGLADIDLEELALEDLVQRVVSRWGFTQ